MKRDFNAISMGGRHDDWELVVGMFVVWLSARRLDEKNICCLLWMEIAFQVKAFSEWSGPPATLLIPTHVFQTTINSKPQSFQQLGRGGASTNSK